MHKNDTLVLKRVYENYTNTSTSQENLNKDVLL